MDRPPIRACVDVQPPRADLPQGVGEMAMDSSTYWPVGSQINVAFDSSAASPTLVARIMRSIAEWSDHANLTFRYVPGWSGADIRVAFIAGQGSYSYIGTGCRLVAPADHTMNLGWLDDETPDDEVRRISLHEFGHAIGCLHEQQQPSASIPWDEAAVYAFYGGPPNYWSAEMIRSQILERVDRPGIQHSDFDGSSIMEYPVPAALTDGRLEIGMNTDLSEEDKIFIGSVYPFAIPRPPTDPTTPTVVPPPVDARTANRLRLLTSINARRARRGQDPLTLDDLFPPDNAPWWAKLAAKWITL